MLTFVLDFLTGLWSRHDHILSLWIRSALEKSLTLSTTRGYEGMCTTIDPARCYGYLNRRGTDVNAFVVFLPLSDNLQVQHQPYESIDPPAIHEDIWKCQVVQVGVRYRTR